MAVHHHLHHHNHHHHHHHYHHHIIIIIIIIGIVITIVNITYNTITAVSYPCHYSGVIMGLMASQITGVSIINSTGCSNAGQKKTSKLRVTCLCDGNSPVVGEFSSKRASNAENVSIWWRHHALRNVKMNNTPNHNNSFKYLACHIRVLLKGLRPVLEGFVVPMHEGACETGSQIPRALARGIWRTVRTSPSALGQQTPTDRS